MATILFSSLKNKALWSMGKETNSPTLINTWLSIFSYLGLIKLSQKKKYIFKQSEFSYNEIVKLSNLFETVIATHIYLRRLTSGTKFGLFNLMLKSLGTSLGFIVLISAATGLGNKKSIIELLIYMPVWILIEVSLTRMSLSIVNDKGLIEILKIKHVNTCLGIFAATFLEYIFTLIVTFPISLYISSELTLKMYGQLFFVLPLSLALILPVGLLISLKFYKQRDQKFIVPIILKGALVCTPFIPLIKGLNPIFTPALYLNPISLIFTAASVNNLSYTLNIKYLSSTYILCILTSLILYIRLRSRIIVNEDNHTIEISTKK
jgi:ABC-type polysaccharide/polyol phosphate export permease